MSDKPMRVVTFNILHGRTVGDGVDPGRLRACIEELDPDVLALQEVDLEQERSGRADLTAVAADAMGAVAHRFVAAISGTPGATWMAATGAEQPVRPRTVLRCCRATRRRRGRCCGYRGFRCASRCTCPARARC